MHERKREKDKEAARRKNIGEQRRIQRGRDKKDAGEIHESNEPLRAKATTAVDVANTPDIVLIQGLAIKHFEPTRLGIFVEKQIRNGVHMPTRETQASLQQKYAHYSLERKKVSCMSRAGCC